MDLNFKDEYNKILNMPHHVSASRRQMPRANRAAQFSSFAALSGYETEISETARLTNIKLDVDEDRKEKINRRLQLLVEHSDERPLAQITYFLSDEKKEGGSYNVAIGNFRRIDESDQTIQLCQDFLITDEKKIPIADIYDIDGDFFGVFDVL